MLTIYRSIDLNKDPFEKHNLAENVEYKSILAKYRDKLNTKMAELGDEFKPCTWYRDHWMYISYSIKAAAKGRFGPIPPIEPMRK